jgi:hypothetical protein
MDRIAGLHVAALKNIHFPPRNTVKELSYIKNGIKRMDSGYFIEVIIETWTFILNKF